MRTKGSAPRKRDVLADELRKMVERNPTAAFPAISDLAQQFDVAYQTMFEAVHLLEKKGLVKCRRGRKTVPASRSTDQGAETALYCKVKQNILQGLYSAGEAMPKVQFFVKSERVATHTVVRLLKGLGRENLIHKQGKRWIIGPSAASSAPSRSAVHISRFAPVVLFVTICERHWHGFFNGAHTIHFASSFNGEITKFGMQLSLTLGEPEESGTAVVPTGIDEINSLIRNLGSRYQGCLVAFNRRNKEALISWIRELGLHGKPVVYFDFNNDGGNLALPESVVRSRYFRLHLDERTAIKLILDELINSGHRTIGVPAMPDSGSFKWAAPRLEMIRSIAREYSPEPEIVIEYLNETFWEFPLSNNIHRFVDNFGRSLGDSPQDPEGIVKRPEALKCLLIAHTPSLVSLLRRGATALIGLNDAIARELYFWARSVGLKIPQSLSIIGMDNKAESAVFPISTVDFGFSHLGYLAAHLLIGDMAIQPDRSRNIPGPCRLIDRGSVGRACPLDREAMA